MASNGWFTVSAPTFNEDGTTVNYYSWSAGAGLGQDGNNHLNLIPKKMVTYAFKENYGYNKTVFLGIINWVNGDKQELHYNFKCQ